MQNRAVGTPFPPSFPADLTWTFSGLSWGAVGEASVLEWVAMVSMLAQMWNLDVFLNFSGLRFSHP